MSNGAANNPDPLPPDVSPSDMSSPTSTSRTESEPSLLDFLKARLLSWLWPQKYPWQPEWERYLREEGSPGEQASWPLEQEALAEAEPGQLAPAPERAAALQPAAPIPSEPRPPARLPWRMLLAFGLGVLGQLALQPPQRVVLLGLPLYILAAALAVWSTLVGEWRLATPAIEEGNAAEAAPQEDPLLIRQAYFWVGLLVGGLAFLALGGGYFDSLNVTLWLLCLALMLSAFWLGRPAWMGWLSRAWAARRRLRAQPLRWNITLTPWTILLLLSFLVGVYFRAYRLEQVPPEMNSDHAEKLLDVRDVLQGETRLFFPRNTGREPLQFYLTAAVARVFGTGLSFLSLKLGILFVGLISLIYMYYLGKEVGNRRTGWLAMTITGFAYWPNVLSRVALRFLLYPAFVAPTLYYFLRGMRTGRRNDFILAGIALGIGLHGYTPIRALPILLVVLVGLYLLHAQAAGRRKQAVVQLAVLALIALVIFLPLLRYALDEPQMFAYRSLTRLGSLEQPLPGPAWQIFLSNMIRALLMFGWDNGEVWPVSVPHVPALDWISAPLFYLGCLLIGVRYVRQRHWLDAGLLVSIPVLLLPSVLALAFPNENPILNRAGGALVPAFLIVALALDGLASRLEQDLGGWSGRIWAWGILGLLLCLAAGLNYDLVFRQYYDQYRRSAWNSSEMGQVIHDFANSVGAPDTAWVVAYPHWVDTRLVGMQAGYAGKDYAIAPDQLESTLAETRPKLFIINLNDSAALTALQQLYPQGWLQRYTSKVETKDFFLFFVPPVVTP